MDNTPRLTAGMFTSRTEEWATPQYVFDALDSEFHFDIDVCASAANRKVSNWFSVEHNGLTQKWAGLYHSCWMNPPYGRDIIKWMAKAYRESREGATVVCLVHARTDTRWWHDYAMKADEIRLVRGRLKFGDGKQSAPFPSCVVIYRPTDSATPTFSSVKYSEAK